MTSCSTGAASSALSEADARLETSEDLQPLGAGAGNEAIAAVPALSQPQPGSSAQTQTQWQQIVQLVQQQLAQQAGVDPARYCTQVAYNKKTSSHLALDIGFGLVPTSYCSHAV